MANRKLISIVIPVYNESPNIPLLFEELQKHTKQLPYRFEILFVDDGSVDDSVKTIQKLPKGELNFRLVQLARNFGKEAAVSAGLHRVKGDAALIMDADLQMPPRIMKEFFERWEKGAEVVVGVFAKRNMSLLKRIGAKSFYRIMRIIGNHKLTPNATDYRLLDRQVVDTFNELTERDRITRGLIDWLGYKQSYVYFEQEERRHGQPTYSYRKLVKLAIDSFTSHSLFPLKLAGYLGVFVLLTSIPLGIFLYIENYILNDPMKLYITGTDMLAVMLLVLVGIILACLGLIALYIARIHSEVINRPLYVVKKPQAEDDIEGEAA